jgi:hypothetical protein
MFDRNRVRGVVDGPKPFFFNEWEAPGTFPVSRILSLVSLPDSTFECDERTRLMNMMLPPDQGKRPWSRTEAV